MAKSGRRPTQDSGLSSGEGSDILDPEATGRAAQEDGFYQATALIDKAELLGELAESGTGVPSTKAAVEATPKAPKGCRLIIVVGPDIGTEWAFKHREFTFGRDEDCEISLPDIGVSRRHARITLEGQRFYITDLGSGNGTYLNGNWVQHEPLESGDEITIGERTLRFVELNDAPSTNAAQPVPHPLQGAEPPELQAEVSSSHANIRGAASQPRALTAASQENLQVKLRNLGRKAWLSGRRSRLTAATAVVGLILIVALVWFRISQRRAEEARAQSQLETQRAFLQAIELVKGRRFGDAQVLLDRVIKDRPEYTHAKDYRAHCRAELKTWEMLESARKLAEQNRQGEALGLLEDIRGDSAYAPEIEKYKVLWGDQVAEALVSQGRVHLQAREYQAAQELVDAALLQSPALVNAQQLQAQVDEAKKLAALPKKTVHKTPRALLHAVELYQNGQIEPAMDAAELVGSPQASVYRERMQRMLQLLDQISAVHHDKAAFDLIRLVPMALRVDDEIAGGEGRVREKLREYYADGLYLKAIEAYEEDDLAHAFRLLSEALKQQPGHSLSEARLADLSKKVRDLYYQGFALKETNAEEARKLFHRVTQITRPDNLYHRKAQKWLANHEE